MNRIEVDRIKKLVTGRPGDPFAGAEDAEHEIVVFVDYGCPYCKLAHTAIRDIIRAHPEIKVTIRDYPVTQLHPDAKNAAIAARCIWNQGESDDYWRYVDLLYAHQDAQGISSLRSYARQMNADLNAYDNCIRSSQVNLAIGQSVLDAENAGISGTPTFFVDGRIMVGVFDAAAILETLGL